MLSKQSASEDLKKSGILDGGLFVESWICHIGNKFTIQLDYYTVINGRVCAITTDGRLLATKDSLFQLVNDCVRIGEFDKEKMPVGESKEFTYEELVEIINKEVK